MGWTIGCCGVELSRGSCPSNSANDVQQTRMEAVGGSDFQFEGSYNQRLCGVQGDIKGGSRVYDRNMGRIDTTLRRHIQPWKRWPQWRIVCPRRVPRAAEDLARTAAGVRAQMGGRYCGQLCAATATLVLSPLHTSLSLLPIATTNATSNSNNARKTRIQRLPLQHACGCASGHCQWLRRSTTAGKCSL